MSGTTVVAIYAAAIATLTFLWSVYAWNRQHRTRVKVEITKKMASASGGPTKLPCAFVTVRNLSGFEIRIDAAEFKDAHGFVCTVPPPDRPALGGIPGVIPARDTRFGWVPIDTLVVLGHLDVNTPLVATVTEATGRRFRSKPTMLQSTTTR